MKPVAALLSAVLLSTAALAPAQSLPFGTVFKGKGKFDALIAKGDTWKALPLGERTAAIGRAMVGTTYKNYTLEVDDRIEAPVVNLDAMDCWTFFENALAIARMLDEPKEKWTPQTMRDYIELDRYRGGKCDGTYLSRLHYLEDWLWDNDKRGLVRDLTKSLGGVRVRHTAVEMTINWKSYRYMRANPDIRAGIRKMEQRVAATPMYHIPKNKVAGIEGKLRNGDIIGITTTDVGGVGTSHVGLAYRTTDGVLRFMHASSPRNFGKVVLDSRLSEYLYRYRVNAGIIVARPVK